MYVPKYICYDGVGVGAGKMQNQISFVAPPKGRPVLCMQFHHKFKKKK